jgi:predicted nucleic acid-binding protein
MSEHRASLAEVDEFLAALASRATQVSLYYRIRPQLSDPNDEMVLETAVNGFADAIVTHNIKDFLPESLKFGIPVWTPGHTIKVRLKR